MSENGLSNTVPDTPERERRQSDSSDNEIVENEIQLAPILPVVHVSTHEENELEFLKIRAKLYRFDATCDPPEWKERGTGELKILRHKEKNSFRVVMRRDKTLKVCLNHFITPLMELKTSTNNEKAFIYSVLADFTFEISKSECFAVKFATIENATLFKSKFEEAKKILLTDCELYNGKVDNEIKEALEKIIKEKEREEEEKEDDTQEISEKLSELKVNKDKKNGEKEKKKEE